MSPKNGNTPRLESGSKSLSLTILDGTTHHPVKLIYVAAGSETLELAAAREFQLIAKRICGQTVPITHKQPLPAAKGVIAIGYKAAAYFGMTILTLLELKNRGHDAYSIQSRNGIVMIFGVNPRATVYGIYRLLQLSGCEFYPDGEERLPKTVHIPGPYSVCEGAAFEWRAMGRCSVGAMKAFLSPGDQQVEVAKEPVLKMMADVKYETIDFWHHTLPFLLPTPKLAKSHPEYLAEIKGSRAPAAYAPFQTHCLSNPGFLKDTIDAVLKWMEQQKERVYFPLHDGDINGICTCGKCLKLAKDKGSVTDATLWFANQVAIAAAKKYPYKFLTMLSYHWTEPPPVKIKPEKNLLIVFCRIRACQARPWTHPVNKRLNVVKDLDAWIKAHPLGAQGIITFEYPITYRHDGMPFPALYAFAENLKLYKSKNIRGVYVCGIGGHAPHHLGDLYNWIIPRLMWNPDADLSALLKEFCCAWYGKAAEAMHSYIDLLHGTAANSERVEPLDGHKGPGQAFMRYIFTSSFCDHLRAILDIAEKQALDETSRMHIIKEKWGLQYIDLFMNNVHFGKPFPCDEEKEPFRELLRIHRTLKRPWVLCHEDDQGFSMTPIVQFEPDREPWWTSPKVSEYLKENVQKKR